MRALVALSFLALASMPCAAAASVCCGDPGGLGQRLASGELAAGTFTLEHRERFGGFDGDGSYAGLSSGDADRSTQVRLAVAAQIVEGAELGVAVPAVVSYRSLGGLEDAGGGVGDITAAARLTVLPLDASSFVPGVWITQAVVVPTGVPVDRTSGPLAADATGQGAPEIRGGVELQESILGEGFVLAAASLGWFGRTSTDGVTAQRAPRLLLSAAGGPTFGFGTFAVGVEHEREGAPDVSGRSDAEGRHLVTPFVSGVVHASDLVDVVFALRSALPVTGAGQNEIAAVTANGGVRLAWDAPRRKPWR